MDVKESRAGRESRGISYSDWVSNLIFLVMQRAEFRSLLSSPVGRQGRAGALELNTPGFSKEITKGL
jgi:hypothetical protein